MIKLQGDRERVESVRFSPDGRTLAAFSWRDVRVYADVRDGAGPTAVVSGNFTSSFTPDGRGIIRYVSEGLAVWNLATREYEALPIPGPFDFSPDGQTFVCCTIDNSVEGPRTLSRSLLNAPHSQMWSVETTRVIGWADLLFLAGGSLVASFEYDYGGRYLVIRDAETGAGVAEVGSPVLRHLRATANHSFVASHEGSQVAVYRADDLAAPPVIIRNDNRKHFTDIAFHPSGRYLAATSNDSTVKFYDTTSWKLAHAFDWDIGRLRSVAFSPDGMLAAAGGDKGKIVVWDVDF